MAVWLRSTTDNFTALVFSLAIIISGLNSSTGAPANSDHEWWINPCSKQPPLRHGRSPAENQLRIFINFIDSKFIKDLKALYNPSKNVSPKVSCLKINPMLTPIRNASTKIAATQAFYEDLLQFALIIDKLKDIPVRTTGEFHHGKRKYIFDEAKESLRLVICEYNDTLSKYEDINIKPNKNKVRKHFECLNPDKFDLTAAYMWDIDFFKKIKKFLKQSRRFLKRKKPKRKNGVNRKSGNKKRTERRKS